MVLVSEAPDEETRMKVLLNQLSDGNLTAQTMRACSPPQMKEFGKDLVGRSERLSESAPCQEALSSRARARSSNPMSSCTSASPSMGSDPRSNSASSGSIRASNSRARSVILA